MPRRESRLARSHLLQLLSHVPERRTQARTGGARPRPAVVAWMAIPAVFVLLAACGPKDAGRAAADMGVAVYTGATPLAVDWKFQFGEETVEGARFRTGDSSRKVHTWYHERYPKNTIIAGDNTDLGKLLVDPQGPDHMLLRVPPRAGDTGGSILIDIKKEPAGGTQIILGRLKKQ